MLLLVLWAPYATQRAPLQAGWTVSAACSMLCLMTEPSRTVYVYRWIVFGLAAAYAVRMVLVGPYDGAGGPFRYLTIWALFCSFFAASRMIALCEGRTTRRWDGFVGMTAVLNGMVVYLYWSMFLADPSSVTRDGELAQWWLEYYLHGLGPVLQWIDALFIHRAFRRPLSSAAWLAGIVLLYVAWAEFGQRLLNDSPSGTVTSGLPYRFLNSLEPADRAAFYAGNLAAAWGLLAGFWLLAWIIRRSLRPEAARPARSGNRDRSGEPPTRP